jgi:hypothetical protein
LTKKFDNFNLNTIETLLKTYNPSFPLLEHLRAMGRKGGRGIRRRGLI